MCDKIDNDAIVIKDALNVARMAGRSLHETRGVPYVFEKSGGAYRVKGLDESAGKPPMVFIPEEDKEHKKGE